MAFILNLIFALLAFFGARYILAELHVVSPVNVLISVLVAIAVFMLDFAEKVM